MSIWKIHGVCNEKDSAWKKIKKISDGIGLTISEDKEKILKSLYTEFIINVSNSQNIFELMNFKVNTMLKIIKLFLFDNHYYDGDLIKIIDLIKNEYWSEEKFKKFYEKETKIYVSDLNEDKKQEFIFKNNCKESDELQLVKEKEEEKEPEYIKITQRLKIDGYSDTYVLTIIGNSKVGLITEDFKSRFSDMTDTVKYFYPDGVISIKIEDLKKFFSKSNQKYRLIN